MILTDRGKRNAGRETCHSGTLCTTNLTRTNLGSNPGLCNFMPATDRLSQGSSPSAVADSSCCCQLLPCRATLRPVNWLIVTDVSEESCASDFRVRQSEGHSHRVRYEKQPVDVWDTAAWCCESGVFVHVRAGGTYGYHHFNGLNVPPVAMCTG
jgi:hypothetical protein